MHRCRPRCWRSGSWWGEVGVALIPHGGGEFRQRWRGFVNGVVRQMGIGDMALHPAHQQIAGDGAATAVLHHISDHGSGGGLADDAPADFSLRASRVSITRVVPLIKGPSSSEVMRKAMDPV